ncbi:MAG: DUF3857 domain-containing protein, partial [Flavisolibacter sp.]
MYFYARVFYIICFSIIYIKGLCQSNETEEISQAQLQMKECFFDKEADAVVIFDKATSNYDDSYRLVTSRRIRIKILKENGVERANIKLRYYSKEDFEILRKIGGFTMTPDDNGNLKKSQLEKKSIYDRKINELYSEIAFALPNVKAGSIIEYWYESIMDHYGGLEDWYFQSDIPVMLSSYSLYVVPNAVFSYVAKISSSLNVDIKQDAQIGKVKFEMRNIPGLRNESFNPSYRDYLQRIDFQLSSVVTRYGNTIKYSNTWDELNHGLLLDKDFGGAIKKTQENSEIKALLDGVSKPFDRMILIHNYVRTNISWDGYDSKYALLNPRSLLDGKKGNSGDINLLLVNLLRGADLEVYPLLVSDR